MRLEFFRKQHGYTQAVLSQKAGVSQCLISAIETGCKTNPTINTAKRLAAALDCSVDALIADSEPEKTAENDTCGEM